MISLINLQKSPYIHSDNMCYVNVVNGKDSNI